MNNNSYDMNSKNNQMINKAMMNKQNNDKFNSTITNMSNSILSSSIKNLSIKILELNKKDISTEKKSGLSNEEINELKEAFDLFDTNGSGKIDPKELKESMKSMGYDKTSPSIYHMICKLDTPEIQEKGGITFDEFVDAVNYELGDTESKEGIRRIFDLITEDPNAEVINLNHLKKLSKELGENSSDEELKEMLLRVSKNGKPEITFEEFYKIMKKK